MFHPFLRKVRCSFFLGFSLIAFLFCHGYSAVTYEDLTKLKSLGFNDQEIIQHIEKESLDFSLTPSQALALEGKGFSLALIRQIKGLNQSDQSSDLKGMTLPFVTVQEEAFDKVIVRLLGLDALAHVNESVQVGVRVIKPRRLAHSDVPDVSVVFRIGSEEVGRAQTDGNGLAWVKISRAQPGDYPVTCSLEPNPEFSGVPTISLLSVRDGNKPLVLVDIDGSLYKGSTIIRRKKSFKKKKPLNKSVEVLNRFGREMDIVFITAQGADTLPALLSWMEKWKFPRYPILRWHPDPDIFKGDNYRNKRISKLKKAWPNLLAGVGDKSYHVRAFQASRLKAIPIKKGFQSEPGAAKNWDEVEERINKLVKNHSEGSR